jgi:hypothetical protein
LISKRLSQKQKKNISTMMKTAIVASLLAGAAAFAPAQQSASTSALQAKKAASTKVPSVFADEIGAQVPLGFFDPLGIVADGDRDTFERLRFAELKHGRIAMLAVVGYLTTEAGIRLPGYESAEPGFRAFYTAPSSAFLWVGFSIAILEIVMRDATGENEFAGDFRNGAIDFGWGKYDDKTKRKKRSIELNNGRAAQMGILGLMVHEQMGVSILP